MHLMMTMMKLTLLFLALLVDSSAAFPKPKLLGRNDFYVSALDEEGRNLQSVCSQLNSQVDSLLETLYGHPFTCSCSGTYLVSCESNGEFCCNEECGSVSWEGNFVLNGNFAQSDRSESCITLSSGAGALNGQPVCVEFQTSGTTITGCDVSIDGTECTSCEPCGQIPGAPEGNEYAAMDCSNIVNGGENVTTSECGDPEIIQEYENAVFQCGLGSSSKAFPVTTPTTTLAIATMMLAPTIVFTSWIWK